VTRLAGEAAPAVRRLLVAGSGTDQLEEREELKGGCFSGGEVLGGSDCGGVMVIWVVG